MMRSPKWLCVFVVDFLVIIVGLGVLLKVNIEKKAAAKYEDKGVPVMDLRLNGVELTEIDEGTKDAKYEGNELTIYNSGTMSEYGEVEVKGRGNGTWVQEKKPYQIKFQQKVDLLGMGKARKWYLLANALDGTNIRTEAATYLEKMLGMRYVLDAEPVELYVDGEYRGLYYLTHAVEVGKTSVDLKNSMGILVELDNIYGGNEEHYVTGNGDLMVIKDAVVEDNRSRAMEDFMRSYNEFEIAVRERDYARVSELVDVETLAQYYLLSEFSVNPDAYWTSFYFYKDGVEDKIHAGPGWDFDLSFANRKWGNWMGERFYSPIETMARKGELMPMEYYEEAGMSEWYGVSLQVSTIMYDLMEMPEFQEVVREMFGERMWGREEELIRAMLAAVDKVRVAAMADEEKWEEEKVFESDTQELIEWTRKRYQYFNEVYGSGARRSAV